MKKSIFLFLGVLVLFLAGCSENDDSLLQRESERFLYDYDLSYYRMCLDASEPRVADIVRGTISRYPTGGGEYEDLNQPMPAMAVKFAYRCSDRLAFQYDRDLSYWTLVALDKGNNLIACRQQDFEFSDLVEYGVRACGLELQNHLTENEQTTGVGQAASVEDQAASVEDQAASVEDQTASSEDLDSSVLNELTTDEVGFLIEAAVDFIMNEDESSPYKKCSEASNPEGREVIFGEISRAPFGEFSRNFDPRMPAMAIKFAYHCHDNHVDPNQRDIELWVLTGYFRERDRIVCKAHKSEFIDLTEWGSRECGLELESSTRLEL